MIKPTLLGLFNLVAVEGCWQGPVQRQLPISVMLMAAVWSVVSLCQFAEAFLVSFVGRKIWYSTKFAPDPVNEIYSCRAAYF